MGFHEQLNECETVEDSLKLAKHTFKQLWDEDADEQEEKERAMGKGAEAEGEGEPGEGEPGEGEGQGEGEGAGKTGMTGTNPHSASDSADGELRPPSVDSDGNCEPPKGGSGVHVETTPPSGRDVEWEAPDAIEHIDFKAHPNAQRNDHNIRNHAEHMGVDLSGANAAMFANKLRRHIMVQSQSFYTHRRGKIGTRHLYKLVVDHAMPGEDRLFKRKHDSDILDTVIGVCVDYSGSMMGERTVLTHVGTELMVHALQVLGVAVEVNMFSTIGIGTTMYTVKHFDERINTELLLDRSERAAMEQANNNDAAAVLWCYNRLMRRPEQRKILLVLSDGHPATHNVRNPQEGLMHVVKGIEADPRVELMGLGITSNAVQRYYTQNVVVSRAEDMSTALIDLIANKMLADSKRS